MKFLIALAVTACGGSTSAIVDAPVAPQPDGEALPDGSGQAVDPAGDGPFTVVESDASIPGSSAGRTLAATVFAPTSGIARPVVIVSPGFKLTRDQYASYARHLATWGFVTILTDYADASFFPDHQALADDVSSVIDWAIAQPALAVDASKVAAAGHSLGGKVSVFAATQDARIKAIVAWDPVDSNNPSVVPEKLATTTAAIAVVGETTNSSGGGMPCAPAAENFTQFYAAAPSPALSIDVAGGDHMDWVDDPSCFYCGFCGAGTASPDVARKVTRRLDVAWLRRQLLDDATMDTWLTAPPELASGAIAVVRK